MPVPPKRRPRSSKRRRASHFAIKEAKLVSVEGRMVPPKYKKALTMKKSLKSSSK